ncbi:MAG: DUF4177 domain-containing protein [Ruegeria sp.]
MPRYEYKVVPAPQKGTKAKGVKTPEGRFANSVEQLLNKMGHDGWEYQRAELLPSEERTGLTGSAVNWRNVLVFRRVFAEAATEPDAAAQIAEPEDVPLARPVPGPEEVLPEPTQETQVTAPAPIAAEVKDPPLTLKDTESVPGEEQDAKDAKT